MKHILFITLITCKFSFSPSPSVCLIRDDSELRYQFKSMLLSVLFQFFLFLTQLLVAINIDTSSIPWSAAFSPLFILPFLSSPACFWNCYRKRSYEVIVCTCNCIFVYMYIMCVCVCVYYCVFGLCVVDNLGVTIFEFWWAPWN